MKDEEQEFMDESLIDGEPAPETEQKPDGRVTVKGEEVPDDVTEVDEKIVDETKSSKPGEPEGVTPETEEPKPLSPEEARFRELGLGKQYPGGIKQMIESQPRTNKYIAEIEAERKRYREEMANREPEAQIEPPSRDDFFDDPMGTINRVMDSKLDGVNEQFDNIRVEAFINSKQDYKQLEPMMIQQLEQNPALKTLGANAVPVLYQMAKATQLSQAQSTQEVQPNPEAKANAETSTGKKATPPDKSSRAYWQGKSLKEMEEELGYSEE